MNRKDFLAQMRKELKAFDTYMAEKYPEVGESGDVSEDMGFGDWFEQYLAFDEDMAEKGKRGKAK